MVGLGWFVVAGVGQVAPGVALGAIESHAPLIHGFTTGTSPNWSGYVGNFVPGGGNAATYVQGIWVVPTVTKTSGDTYSSTWIGIDGDQNSDLIQTGTEQDWVGGKAVYRCWWEILPAAETLIPSITVHPGDEMEAVIQNTTGSTWKIEIEDATTGKSFTVSKTYTGPADSVEWIQEATTINGKVATLAHYGSTFFNDAGIEVNHGALIGADLQTALRLKMKQNGKIVSTPGKPNSSGLGFGVAYGKVGPAPPPNPTSSFGHRRLWH
jgi:hypothetical protein